VGQNLKYVAPEQKIYRSEIIYKINLKSRIVLSAACGLHGRPHTPLHLPNKSTRRWQQQCGVLGWCGGDNGHQLSFTYRG
jgi:hypothetical protein